MEADSYDNTVVLEGIGAAINGALAARSVGVARNDDENDIADNTLQNGIGKEAKSNKSKGKSKKNKKHSNSSSRSHGGKGSRNGNGSGGSSSSSVVKGQAPTSVSSPLHHQQNGNNKNKNNNHNQHTSTESDSPTKTLASVLTSPKNETYTKIFHDDDDEDEDYDNIAPQAPKKDYFTEIFRDDDDDEDNDDVVNLNASHDSESETGSQNDNDDDEEDDDMQSRRVSFADDAGLPLQQVRLVEKQVSAFSRIVVLLLSPEDRVFEFLHAEFPLDDSTTVDVLLEQLPLIATNEVFNDKTFVAISRTKNNTQLENSAPLQDCSLDESELVLGVMEGFSVPDIAAFALPLLVNQKILKAVNHAKRTGRGLKIVKSGDEWYRQVHGSSSTKSGFDIFGGLKDKWIKLTAIDDEEDEEDDGNDNDAKENAKATGEEDDDDDGNEQNNVRDNSKNKDDDDKNGSRILNDTGIEYIDSKCADKSSNDINKRNDEQIGWKLLDIRNIFGDERTEHLILFIHAILVLSAGILLTMTKKE